MMLFVKGLFKFIIMIPRIVMFMGVNFVLMKILSIVNHALILSGRLLLMESVNAGGHLFKK